MGQSGDGLVEGKIDVSRDEIAHDLGGPSTIRRECKAGAGDLLKIDSADVLSGSRSRRALGGFVRVCVKPGNQLFHVGLLQVPARDYVLSMSRLTWVRLEAVVSHYW